MSVIFITGANRGLGLEFVRQYATLGHEIIATTREGSDISELESIKGNISIKQLDIKDTSSITLCLKNLNQPIDILIANAGIYGPRGSIDDHYKQAWLETFEVNAIAPVLLAHAALDHIRRGQNKKIIAITSRMGSIADNDSGGSYAYRSSKAALNAAYKSLAIDLKDEGIHVNVLHPGWVKTDMGGPNGLLTPQQSISGMIKLIDKLNASRTGKFYHTNGDELEW